MKVIFLDIDGVLNSTTDFLEERLSDKFINSKNTAKVISPVGVVETLSPGKLLWLQEIVEQTDAKIVISSAWREMYSLKELYQMFSDRGFSLPVTTIIGKTEILSNRPEYDEFSRSKRITAWLEKMDNVESYVILDDLSKESFKAEHHNHLALTNIHDGLNYPVAMKAIEILGRNEKYQERFLELQKYEKVVSHE